jgi:hypothetical protein
VCGREEGEERPRGIEDPRGGMRGTPKGVGIEEESLKFFNAVSENSRERSRYQPVVEKSLNVLDKLKEFLFIFSEFFKKGKDS